ncbi:MAG TPA: RNA 3'-terminal phosphate cyclase [Gemmataceae bacterium]|jgi:RNA 3'-terminal phosphate cyclase (ATP)|nr:RNA 3'-terminal phosphate cyclase [Gemmataceae bacterium]
MIDIDGSFGEGGGQILRSSLTLALMTGQAFRLRNVRARRAKPGLRSQHLTAVRAAAEVGRAQTRGASVGSSQLEFEPQTVQPGNYHFAIGTAGATTLVLHAVYLPLALQDSPSHLVFEGGTHNEHAPCYHFLATTWQSYLVRIGLPLTLHLDRAGFYPRGGGRFTADIAGTAKLRGLTLTERPPITRAIGFSAVSGGLPEHIARRQMGRAKERLDAAGLEADVGLETWNGGPGSVLALMLDEAPVPTLYFGLGARGKRAEAVADDAVEQVLDYVAADAPVDEHSADQLILPLAFAEGPSEYHVSRVTKHLLTNVEIVHKFIPRRIEIDSAEGEPGTVRIEA